MARPAGDKAAGSDQIHLGHNSVVGRVDDPIWPNLGSSLDEKPKLLPPRAITCLQIAFAEVAFLNLGYFDATRFYWDAWQLKTRTTFV